MTDMPKAAPARDHLWVLAVIAACVLAEVWASWVTIGAKSGFPEIGGVPTDWTLAVTTEAYWGYALYAWLAASPGPRSRRFAMWSAAAVFALSIAGQSLAHLTAGPHHKPPDAVVVFVTSLPVVVLALIAVLIHLRQKDREEVAEAVRQDAKDAEIGALRERLEALAGETAPLREALAAAQREAEQANARAESATAKLAARKPHRTRTKAPNAGRRKDPNAATNGKPNAASETGVPADFDARAEALEIYLGDPQISGKDLGAKVGLGERWGQLRKAEFAKSAPTGQDRSDP